MERAALGAIPLILVLVASGCGPRSLEWNAVSTGEAELRVWEATARFIMSNYEASHWTGEPAAFCLVVGRREAVARRQKDREPSWAPPAALLSRLGDMDPPVVPIPACTRNGDLQEILAETGAPVVVIGLSHPDWEGPNLASVQVSVRENPAYGGRWDCRLSQSLDGWSILDCV